MHVTSGSTHSARGRACACPCSQGDVVESCRLQCLAQRLLTTFKEAVTVGLEGAMLSAAPTGENARSGVLDLCFFA